MRSNAKEERATKEKRSWMLKLYMTHLSISHHFPFRHRLRHSNKSSDERNSSIPWSNVYFFKNETLKITTKKDKEAHEHDEGGNTLADQSNYDQFYLYI